MRKIKCPRCGMANRNDVIHCGGCTLQLREVQPSVSELPAPEMPAMPDEIPTAQPLPLVPAAPRKKRAGLLAGIAIGVLALAAAGVAAVLLLRQPKTLGVTPEEIEGWYRDADAAGDSTAGMLCELWDLTGGVDIDYSKTNDKTVRRFMLTGSGMDIIGFVDKESGEILHIVYLGDMYDGFHGAAPDYDSETIEGAAQLADTELFAVVLKNTFGLTSDAAEEMAENSKNGEEIEKDGVTYHIEGYTYEGDMAFVVTSFEDKEELLDYIEE